MLLSVNRIKFRVVTSLLTVHNTVMRHPYIMGLIDSPLCRMCGAEEDTSAHVLFECFGDTETYPFAFPFLDPEDVLSLGLKAIWNFIKGTGLP